MKFNSILLFHIRKLRNLSFYNAEKYLIKNDFIKIGCGCESVVYSKRGFDYVIKLQFSPFGNSGSKEDIPHPKHFANQQVFEGHGYNLIIQEKVDKLPKGVHTCKHPLEKRYNKFVAFLENTFRVGDTHSGNIGYKNGKFIIFDWTNGY